MRHADRPDDPDDPDLSSAGVVRAEHLATYIPQTFGKPDYIIATARSKDSDRPLETVEPLVRAVGVPVQHDIRIFGQVMASVGGRRVSLQSTSRVEGDVYHQVLILEQGAFFEGKSVRSDDPLVASPPTNMPGQER